jgi:hypothetical protein
MHYQTNYILMHFKQNNDETLESQAKTIIRVFQIIIPISSCSNHFANMRMPFLSEHWFLVSIYPE